MNNKNQKPINRRSFIHDAGKTVLLGTISASAVAIFFQGCTKSENCNVLNSVGNGDHTCSTKYICTDPQGFSCPESGEFLCESEGFSCYTEFICTADNNFSCQPTSGFSNPVGGSGG